jgi:formamidopyrimidine-DNA glycosylase
MPELPEVETMVRGLRPVLTGRKLRRLDVLDPFLIDRYSPEDLSGTVSGATVLQVERRGKWVVMTLADSRGIIVIQPRMTGGFWLLKPERPNHIRLKFHLDNPKAIVWFCDTRRLGKIAWYEDAPAAEREFRSSHGPDALEITRDQLAERLSQTGRGIKPTLMDQKVLAGIGNIYADEVLHHARIHPEQPARSLTIEELDRIHRAIGEVLRTAIDLEGSSFDAGYRTVLGLEGGFLTQNAVYGRENHPCRTCFGPVLRAHIYGLSGRSTYYCPRCQIRS